MNKNSLSYFLAKAFDVVELIVSYSEYMFCRKIRINGNLLQGCPKNVCLPLETKLCDEDFENCHNISSSSHNLNLTCQLKIYNNENECRNLVKGVKYNIYHNGTNGVIRTELYLNLGNVSYYFGDKNFLVSQNFEVNFLWFNYSLNYSLLLSGNPGYLVGKPILSSNLIPIANNRSRGISNRNESSTKYKIIRNPAEIADNFLIFPASKHGICVRNNRTYIPIEFGYNVIIKCKVAKMYLPQKVNLTSTEYCKNLQNIVFSHWSLQANDSIRKIIGNFGNANESVLSHWKEIVFEKSPVDIVANISGNFRDNILVCRNLVNTLKIDFFHSRVDFKNAVNQEKILATTYRFQGEFEFEFPLFKNRSTALDISTRVEVMFFDVTMKKVKKYVDPPTFKIVLPYDFFYPFIKVEGNGSVRFIFSYGYLKLILCSVLTELM